MKIVKSDDQTTTYEYDAFGNLVKTTTEIGSERLVTTYKYDNMNRLITLTNFKDVNQNGVFDTGEGISEFEYTLNDIGQKTNALEKFWADYDNDGIIDLLINNIDWEYDSLGRLTSEVFDHYANENDQTSTWEYDVVGNRLRQEVDKGNNGTIDNVTTYEYDENDRLIEEVLDDLTAANKDKVTKYGYDHTQQISKSVSENGVLVSETAFEYDAQGRMSAVIITTFDENGVKTRIERTAYEYGADGIRVSALHEIDVDGDGTFDTAKLTEYLNDPLNITGYSQVLKQVETDLETGEQTHIIYVIGHQRMAQIVTDKAGNQQEYYFTYDGHGSTRVLLNIAGAVAQLYSFDAYGNALGFNPAEALTEFLYSGEQFDAKIGQQYLRARYYDPATGRFNRLDPFFGNTSDPQSFHKYLYTHADPINGVDPSGKMSLGSVLSGIAIGGMAGGLISGGYTLATTRSLKLAGQAALKGAILGAIAGAVFPIAAAGFGYSATAFGASKGLGLAISFWGASGVSGAIPAYLESVWNGNDPLGTIALTDAGMGGAFGLITAGVFKFGMGAFRGSYTRSIPAPDSIDDVALYQVMERVKKIANDPVFLQKNGLQNNIKAQELFFELVEKQLTPSLSNESGAAVGLLNVKQANGEIKQILSLALPKGASDYTITHELAHVARQAASKTSPKGFDLFLFEASTPNFDPMYWNIFLREETAAHTRAARVILTDLEQ